MEESRALLNKVGDVQERLVIDFVGTTTPPISVMIIVAIIFIARDGHEHGTGSTIED